MAKTGLTATTIKNAKPRATPYMLADRDGLYLRVGPTGSTSWIMRYSLDGRRRDMGLGSYPDVSISAARELAAAQRRLRISGSDPIAARRTARAVAKQKTFAECAETYIVEHRPGWKTHASEKQWRASLATHAYPILGDMLMDDIKTADVLKVVKPIWGRLHETAARVRFRIEQIMAWAIGNGDRSNDVNPADQGHLKAHLVTPLTVQKTPMAAMPFADLPAFMAELRTKDHAAARALEFMILTAVRPGEVAGDQDGKPGVPWSEVDLNSCTWTIPAARMKRPRPHDVPLSSRAVEILSEMSKVTAGQSRVFPLSFRTMTRQVPAGFTAHGFRSSFRDWCAEHGVPDRLAEISLAHKLGADATEAAYLRTSMLEQRRAVMQRWSDFCAGIDQTATVVPFKQTAT